MTLPIILPRVYAPNEVKEGAELALLAGKAVASSAGRTTFDAAKLAWSPVMMAAESFGSDATKAGALGAYNGMDKWKNILFPDVMKAAEPGHVGFDPETGKQIPWQPKDSLLQGLESMAMKPSDVAKAPAKALVDLTVGTGTLLPGKLSKPFDNAMEFYDKALAPSNGGEGNSVLSGAIELGLLQGLKKPTVKQAAKAGRFSVGKGILAGDDVPESIFGIPVVASRDQYTEEDIAFFSEHPEAGGYYQTDSDEENADGPEGIRGDLFGGFRKRVGEAGEVADAGLAWVERQHAKAIDMLRDVQPRMKAEAEDYAKSGNVWKATAMGTVADLGRHLANVTETVLTPATLGARVTVANMTSGGGKYYQPEVRDQRYFSQEALKELGSSMGVTKGRTSGRVDGTDNAAQFGLTQTVGGFSIKDGKITDTFDINKRYTGVPQALTNAARFILGKQEDPDAGKVRTEVPLSALKKQDAKGGSFGLRNDGVTYKGTGWLGVLKTSDGGVATEYTSQSDAVRGKDGNRIDFPTLVPTLSPDEVKLMTDDIIPGHKAVPDGIMQKAVDHALKMQKEGRSVFANDGEPGGWDPYKNAEDAIKLVIPFIKNHEGFREKAYLCPAGKWTVGYGQTEIDGRPVKAGDTITEADAAKFVERRVRSNAAELYRDRAWSRNVSTNALAALYDIAYNAGTAALSPKRSPGLNSEMESADMDFDSIVWNQVPTYRTAGGKVVQGLVNRRNDAIREWRK